MHFSGNALRSEMHLGKKNSLHSMGEILFCYYVFLLKFFIFQYKNLLPVQKKETNNLSPALH